MKLQALPDSSELAPGALRAQLLAEQDTALCDRVVAMAMAHRELGLVPFERLAAAAGLPVGEVLASPFAPRAVAQAVALGGATVHHECRAIAPWPEALAADPAIAADPHGTWERGVLYAGKYRQFMQDEPFATYNPNHMAKWGPHELMHRACGFFWRADATRWEVYLTARLNELVPVVLWYGLDEVARGDRDGFDRVREAADRDTPLARVAWWTESEASLRARVARTLHNLRDGLRHYEAETAAVDREVITGSRVPVDHPVLDASSDAIAYVVGHYPRLVSEEAAMLGDAFFGPEMGVDATVAAYQGRIEAALHTLLAEPLEVDFELAKARRAARRLWDIAQRATLHPRFMAARAASAIASAGEVFRAAWHGDASDVDEAVEGVLASIPRSARSAVRANGLAPETDADAADAEQLLDGMRSLCPATTDALLADGWSVDALVAAPRSRTDLAARLAPLVDDVGATWLSSLFRFECAIAAARSRDDVAERLGEVPFDEDGAVEGVVHRNAGFSLVPLAADPAELHYVWSDTGEVQPELAGPSVAYLVGAAFEEVSVLPAPPEVAALWEALAEGPSSVEEALVALDRVTPGPGLPEDGEAWLDELCAALAVYVIPSPAT